MLKKMLFASFVAGASLVSFQVGQGGAPQVQVPSQAKADNPCQELGAAVCDTQWYWMCPDQCGD